MINRRTLIAATVFATLHPLYAQEFPSKQITIVVPFAAGGGADIIGRTIAERLSQDLGKAAIVENRPGAGSNTALNAIAKGDIDGHTIGLASIALAVNPFLYKVMPFDAGTDLIALTLALETPNILIVPMDSPAKTVADLIALAKTKPLSYASAGIGTSLHLAAELFQQQAGVTLTHVPYRGSAPALTDLITGRIDMMFDNASTALPQIEGGKVRAIAVTSKARLATLPNVPSIAEGGLPNYELANWWTFVVAKDTPKPIVEKLTAALQKALNDPQTKDKIASISGRVIASDAALMKTFLPSEMKKWEEIIKKAGIAPQ
jgi:tripartite-type tricarboxylate transporter receptor subunit TctC